MIDSNKIRPLPQLHGIGFTSFQPLKDVDKRYRVEKIDRYYNYYMTQELWKWPCPPQELDSFIIDAFSPNMNKDLHVGHLRNLVIAKSLDGLFPSSRFVSILGFSLGEKQHVLDRLKHWFDFVGYHPEIFRDIDFSLPLHSFHDGEDQYKGCLVWDGPNGPVLIRRSKDHPTRPNEFTYSYHELAFNHDIKPDYIMTGAEQAGHFKDLGLEKKYLSMGLVLDPVTGGKMKSRDGSGFGAVDAIDLIREKLRDTAFPIRLSWNVLAWNFLKARREKGVIFNFDDWVTPEAPGMYITYTVARIKSALKKIQIPFDTGSMLPEDVELVGFSSYFDHWLQICRNRFDASPLAHFAHDLSKKLTAAYEREKIIDGRKAFQFSVSYACNILTKIMEILSMFVLETV